MHSPPLALLLASLHLATTAYLPTPPPLTHPNILTLPPLTHPNLIALPPTNNSTTTYPLINPPTTSESFERIDYLIPQTTTYISVLLFTHHPLPPMEAEIVLSAIEHQLTTHIATHGDGPLTDADDPYEFGLPGAHCSTSSAIGGALTYGVLRDTMRGLQHVVVGGRRFYKAFYDISKGDAGGRKLGEGCLEAEGLGPLARSQRGSGRSA